MFYQESEPRNWETERVPAVLETKEPLEIPEEYILAEQQLLMRLMIPKEIGNLLVQSDGEQVGIEDAFFVRWCGKYSKLFRDYTNLILRPRDEDEDGEDERMELRERLISGRLASDDYLTIRHYLEDPSNNNEAEGIGGEFFESQEEVDKFLEEYRLSLN